MTGALLLDFGVECNYNYAQYLIEEHRSDILLLREYARIHRLDTKQRIAFEVGCCTSMLHYIERILFHYNLGINNISTKKRHKKQENYCQQL